MCKAIFPQQISFVINGICVCGETGHKMIELSELKKDTELNFIKTDSRNVAIVGAGAVGMSYAYSLLCRSVCDKLCIIDIDSKRAEGEAADLSHGVAFAESNMKITSGTYDMASDADILAICAGSAQRDGEDRLSLLQRNAGVVRGIVGDAIHAGFNGIFLVVTNPVDIMTLIALEASGFSPERVIGSGTTLDTARLRHQLGDYFEVDPRNVHAYVMGEHGDSEFIPWSQAMVATKPVFDVCDDNPAQFRYEDLINIGENVRGAAQKIIAAKGSTCYGIGMAMTRITRAVFGNENSILTVSSFLRGEYGQNGVCAGSPCIVGRTGVKSKVRLSLQEYELKLMDESCRLLKNAAHSLSGV